MISAFDVYLVMQLDSIRAVAAVLSAAGAIATSVTITHYVVDEDKNPLRIGGFYALFLPTVLAVAVATLLPSSKTAAAMIILPALTSDKVTEPLAREAGELYGLAKKALEQAVDSEPSTQTSQEESK